MMRPQCDTKSGERLARRRRGYHLEQLAFGILMLGIAVTSGCATGAYYASDLPMELQAPHLARGTEIDFAKFAKPTTTTDILEPGDVLEIAITTGLETRYMPRWRLRLDDEGLVTVPIVGPVRLGGLALSHADRAIYDAAVSRGYFRNPNVAVKLIDRRASRIVVAGAVKKPGAYDLPSSSCDVLSALVAAGGLTPEADTVVMVRQPHSQQEQNIASGEARFASYPGIEGAAGGQQEFTIDLAQGQHVQDWDVALQDGAVITIRERPDHMVAVMGKVKRPGQFEMPKDSEMRFLDAIALAGGRTVQFADKAYVVRQADGGADPVLIRVSISDAKGDPNANIRLAPGDVVSIEETPLTVGVETLTKMIRLGFSSRIIF